MVAIVPIEMIEMTFQDGEQIPRVAGTGIRVSEIVIMYLKNGSSIDWIVENFDALDHAKVHAALAYYYSHQAEIEAEINEPVELPGAVTLPEWKEQIKRRKVENQ
jgi:uncharacterized protein (DUF433 family)